MTNGQINVICPFSFFRDGGHAEWFEPGRTLGGGQSEEDMNLTSPGNENKSLISVTSENHCLTIEPVQLRQIDSIPPDRRSFGQGTLTSVFRAGGSQFLISRFPRRFLVPSG